MEIIDSFEVFFERHLDVASPITLPLKERPPFESDLLLLVENAWRAYQKQKLQPERYLLAADTLNVWVHFNVPISIIRGVDEVAVLVNGQITKQIPTDAVMCHIYNVYQQIAYFYDDLGSLGIFLNYNPDNTYKETVGYFVVNFGKYLTLKKLREGVNSKIRILVDEILYPCFPRHANF